MRFFGRELSLLGLLVVAGLALIGCQPKPAPPPVDASPAKPSMGADAPAQPAAPGQPAPGFESSTPSGK